MSSISIIIITKNEEQDIRRCLESVSWADEIIILDSGSTDNTIPIAKKYTDNIFNTDWPGFGVQKNRALSKATKEWVLSIDADEWLTDDLIMEIKNIIKTNSNYAFNIPRKSYYCGKLIKFGHWRNDKVLRLFKRNSGKFTNDSVHEKLIVSSKIKITKNYMLHNSFENHEDVLNKMNSYSTLSANMRFANGKKGGLFKAISHGIWAFFNSYLLKLGFLDGKAGLMLAISFAEGTYYRYVKLLLQSEQKSLHS